MHPTRSDGRAPSSPAQRCGRGAIACWLIAALVVAGCTSSRQSAASTAPPSGAETSAPSTVTTTTAAAPTTTAPASTTTVPETTTTEAPTTTTTSPPTTTTTPLVTEGATVVVANATNLQGGAAKMSDKLAAAGFHMGNPTNTAGSEEFRDTTAVYFLPAGEAVATSLAMVMGVPLARMPTPAPITDATAGLGDATVLVLLGRDLVGKTPPGLQGR